MRTLDFRRHQESTRKAWVKRVMKHRWSSGLTTTIVGKLAHSAVLCSCYQCGNPRKYLKEGNVSERRLLDSSKDDINNWIRG